MIKAKGSFLSLKRELMMAPNFINGGFGLLSPFQPLVESLRKFAAEDPDFLYKTFVYGGYVVDSIVYRPNFSPSNLNVFIDWRLDPKLLRSRMAELGQKLNMVLIKQVVEPFVTRAWFDWKGRTVIFSFKTEPHHNFSSCVDELDFTGSAVFLNLNTNQLFDFTGRGLRDLESKR